MTAPSATTPQPYQHRLYPGDDVDPRNHGLGGDSDRQRLLDTFAGRPTDRRPTLEYLIDRRCCEAILGKPAANSWNLEAEDFVALALTIGQDAIGGPIFAKPSSLFGRVPRGTMRSRADLRRLKAEGVIAPMRLDEQALERFLNAIEGTGLALWHHLSAGLTQVYEAMGLEAFGLCLYDEPTLIRELLDMAMDENQRVLESLLDYPLTFIHVGDDLGHKGGLLFRPQFLAETWMPRLRRCIAPAREAGVPLTFHSDGDIREVIPMIVDMGFVSLNPIEPYGMDIAELAQRYGDRLTFIGNIDVAGPLAFGSPAQVRQAVRELLERLPPGTRHVGATSHSVLDDIPPENFLAMVAAFQGRGLAKNVSDGD